MVLAQTAAEPVAIAGTILLFGLFLSVTAHLAARNVLGDVAARRALLIGPLPATVAFLTVALDVAPLVGLLVAIVLDGVLFARIYGVSRRLAAYVTVVHFVVTVILGTFLFGVLTLANTAPV